MREETTSVLVVGGSLVGLSTALFTSWQGVPTVLVERHSGSSAHPRAIGYTTRTVELLRAVGLGARIPEVPFDFRLRRARVESLAGRWLEESKWTPDGKQGITAQHSPCSGAAIAQDQIEPILRDRAVELGADVRLGTELLRFEQDAAGVTAWVRPRAGDEYRVRASYLVAADGGRSAVREALGIGSRGRGPMRTMRSVLFRAPLDEYLERGIQQFEIAQKGWKAFLTTYHDGRWVLMFGDDVERSESELRDGIFRAIGRSDLAVEIITTGRWELSATVADRFSLGRVFLAGDAAHCLPPTRGGYGANTGIHDAHNLAWKIAAVQGGSSTPALLETYHDERRPVAWARHQQLFARPDYRAEGNGIADGEPIFDDVAMELGQLYRSAAIDGAGPELPAAARPEEWAGQPGTRAPHFWIARDGERRSTLDLFQRGWVLLAGDPIWEGAARAVGASLKVPVGCAVVGRDLQAEDERALRSGFGIGSTGASLIRPDGYIGWRAADASGDPGARLANALARIACAQR